MKFLLILLLCDYAISRELQKIDFFQEGEISKLELTFDSVGVKASKFHIVEDKQIVVDLEEVTANPKVMRAFDTSEFSGTVVFVSPYKKPGSKNDLRMAIQLRDNARSILDIQGNRVILLIENRFGVFSQLRMREGRKVEEGISKGEIVSRVNIPKSERVEDILDNLTLSGPKKYIGKKMSLNVRDVPIVEILKMIADTSGFNIIVDQEILKLPNLTLNLTSIPWDQALDTILNISKLVARKNGNILLISTLEKATKERELELQALNLAKKQETLVTKIFRISYAVLGEIQEIIKEYLTPSRGKVSADQRTNSLIVKDTVEAIDRIRKIIETLDTQTPQILIESKVVEVTESYAKQLGLPSGIQFGYDPVGTVEADEGPGFSISTAPSADVNMFSLEIARWSRVLDVSLALQLMESESKARIVSSPRVITENKRPATISSTETTSFLIQGPAVNGVLPPPTVQPVPASLNLTVTPQVTNEGSIAMQVSVSKTDFGTRPSTQLPPDTTNRTVNTNVLVDNGSTVVIGGVYRLSTSTSHSGIPLLKDIPLLGWLFRTSYNPQSDKTEMVIFLTPRIINQEEAGLVDRDEPVG